MMFFGSYDPFLNIHVVVAYLCCLNVVGLVLVVLKVSFGVCVVSNHVDE